MFFVPLAYFMSTRLIGMPAIASWIMIYPVPIVVSTWAFNGTIDAPQLLALIIAMIGIYTLYELGYMDNDTRTVVTERAPTERLNDAEKTFYRRWQWMIALSRFAVVVVAFFVIGKLVRENQTGNWFYLAGLVTILLAFPVYNSLRGRVNLPLHFILVACRFCMPGLILITSHQLQYVIVMIAAFPVINLLERCGEPRYRFAHLAPILGRRNRSRVIYYLMVFQECSSGSEIYLFQMPAKRSEGHQIIPEDSLSIPWL